MTTQQLPGHSAGARLVLPAAVRRALLDKAEIALLDVRPEARFAAGHPLFAASLPASRLEAEVLDRLPRRTVPVVLYGDSPDDAATAAARVRRLGYADVSVLDGGLAGWTAAGGEVFRGVNVPSKAFGELVQARARTPAIGAGQLSTLLGKRADVVVLDARRFEEYQTMSIPAAVSVPGAELALRAGALAPDPATLIVVNCAGRTRSIIGAQSLISAGIPNPVVALRDGTIGWTLAGLELEHGQQRRAPEVTPAAMRRARAAAWPVARQAGVRAVSGARLASLLAAGQRTVYCLDVRSPEEYAAGHLPGFRPAPGGQLVQQTDWYAPVRGALLVLADDDGGRAALTASWLAQMGWDTRILQPGVTTPAAAAGLVAGPWVPARPEPPRVRLAGPDQVESWQQADGAIVADLGTSVQFRAGRLPGAVWATQDDLPAVAQEGIPGRGGPPGRLVLTSDDGLLAAFAADRLTAGPRTEVAVLEGGTSGWARSGRPLESGPGLLLSSPADVYRRPYEGTDVPAAAMRAYLEWEHGLVEQLDRDGAHGFTVLT